MRAIPSIGGRGERKFRYNDVLNRLLIRKSKRAVLLIEGIKIARDFRSLVTIKG